MSKFQKNIKEKQRNWPFYFSSQSEIRKLTKNVDEIFSNYSFFPEIDWGKYNHRPPDCFGILGAWRHPSLNVYAFLLDNSKINDDDNNKVSVLWLTGEGEEYNRIERKFDLFKNDFIVKGKKEEKENINEIKFERFQTAKSFKTIMLVLSLLTTIINVFSIYLRQLPTPNIQNEYLAKTYYYLVLSIHFSALILLLIAIYILIIIFIKYLIIFLKRT